MKKLFIATALLISSVSLAAPELEEFNDYTPDNSTFGFEAMAEAFQINQEEVPGDPEVGQPAPAPTPQPPKPERPHPKMPAACQKLNLSAEQKKQIFEAMFAHKKAKIQLDSDLKIARMDYVKNILDETGSAESAAQISAKIAETVTGMANNKLALSNKVYFEILTPAQRPAGLMCEHAMKKRMERGHNRGGGRDHHDGRGRRGHGGERDKHNLN